MAKEINKRRWNITMMAMSLNSMPEPIYKPGFRWGEKFRLGDYADPVEFEVYPAKRAAFVTTRRLNFSMFDIYPADYYETSIVFRSFYERNDWGFHINEDGAMSFIYEPVNARLTAVGEPR